MKRIGDRWGEMVDVDLDVSGMERVVRRIQNREWQPFHPFPESYHLPSGAVKR